MTPVKFEFLEPDGTPLANLVFEIKMAKSGFLESVDGIVMPDTVEATTDELGVVTVMLAPSSSLYYLKVLSGEDVGDGCCPTGIFYKFYVPAIDTVVRVQDLIMDPPPSTTAWDEAAILKIMEAKVESAASAAAALESENAAGLSASNAAESEAVTTANAAFTDERAADALISQEQSKLSELASKASQEAARASELAAAASAEFAGSAVSDMQEQVDEATRQAVLAGESATSSAQSAGQSANSAGQASTDAQKTAADVITSTANKNATAADVVTSTGLKADVTQLKAETKGFRDETAAMVGSLGAVITNGGPVDLSGGAYPAKPIQSTLWKVTVGGTVGGAQGDVYGIGDTLMYALEQDLYYKIDNTENVSSVAGKTGAVSLDKVDVGLPRVDNTNDLEKPISTAAAAAFAARTPTTSPVDETPGHLLKVGDFGFGGAAIAVAESSMNSLTRPSMLMFVTAGALGVLPTNANYYVNHFKNVDGFAIQTAWAISGGASFTRALVNNVWQSTWTPSTEIVDNLTSTDPAKALSAKQGKVLYDMVQANNATVVRYSYNIAQGQTAVTGPDVNGKTLSYVPGGVMLVNFNGFELWVGQDFTASNGSLLTLITAAELPGEMSITVFGSFSVANMYTKPEADVLIAGVKPHVGKIEWEPNRAMVPVGGIALDGLLYSRATYPDLWNLINTGKLPVIAEATWQSDPTQRAAFTTGTDGTNFRMADYNGKATGSLGAVFQRGDGLLAPAAGVIQRDAFQGHTFQTYWSNSVQITSGAGVLVDNKASSSSLNADPVGRISSNPISDGTNGSPRVATETRPIGVSGVWFIYAFGSVNNAGALDASTLAANQTAQASRIGVLEASEKKVYLCAKLNPAWVDPAGPARVYWDTPSISQGGIVWDATGAPNNWFVLPIAGVYRITISLLCNAVGTAVTMGTDKGGVNGVPTQCYLGGTLTTVGMSHIGRFAAGDKVWATLSTGTLFNPSGGAGSNHHSITIERIDN